MTNPAMSPPSVLLIMVDQLGAAWLPAYGHDIVNAPHISGLSARGLTFDAAYCPSPLCAPSRSAMLAGRHSSRVGVYDNAAELAATVPTLTHHLRNLGYHTALAGKMHFVGPDQLHGFERRLTTDVYPAGADWTPDWTRPVSDRLPWYHSMESVLTPARCVAAMQTDYDDEVAFHAARHLRDLARHARDEPFFLVASFTNPHDPWEIPSRYWDRYDPEAIALPAVALDPEHEDPHSRRLRIMCGADQVTLEESQIRRARHAYYAAISYVDERIGEVLAALRETGLDESTTVVFCADHGEFLGERGLWYKMSLLDTSARVPLIVATPGRRAERASGPVSTLDLAPTLLELAAGPEVAAAADFDGVSRAGLLAGQGAGDAAGGLSGPGGGEREAVGGEREAVGGEREAVGGEREAVVAEYHGEGVNAPAAMIREGAMKLIVCATDPDQLYDLAADPLELRNLAGDERFAETVAGLRAQLDARLDLPAIGRAVLASQRERQVVASALGRGEVTPWDFQPHVDAAMQYVRNRADLYELQRRARLEG